MYDYILIDCNRIQEYVFASNRLREICNASRLLDWIETEKIPQIATSYTAEVIRCGGGICLLKISNGNSNQLHNEILNLFKRYGIDVTSVSKPISPSGNFYSNVLSPLFKDINFKKYHPNKKQILSSSILSVPCEASGSSPAEYVADTPDGKKRYNLPSTTKLCFPKNESDVEIWLKGKFQGFEIPHELEGIVSWSKRGVFSEKEPGTSEKRLLGVIYADVNSLGALTKDIATDEETYKEFSAGLREAIKCSVFDALCNVIGDAIKKRKSFPSDKALPLRVLYIGGDDLALAVQGCFALDITRDLLSAFGRYSKELLEKTELHNSIRELTMSAGVVIAPHKYPFLSINRLGKELEQRAKSAGRLKKVNNISPSYIDFCIVKNNTIGGLNEIWSKVDNRLLSGGPYTLEEINTIQKHAESLIIEKFPMSKLKGLVNLLRSSSRARLYKIWEGRLKEEQQRLFKDVIISPFSLNGSDVPLWRENPLGLLSTPLTDIIDLIPIIKVKRRGGE